MDQETTSGDLLPFWIRCQSTRMNNNPSFISSRDTCTFRLQYGTRWAIFFFCGGITSLGSLATKLRIVTEPSHLVPKPFVCNVQLAAEVVRG